jgi:glycosyltransferase involved in cell wall biosynthesis
VRVLVLSNLYPPDAVGGYELGCRQVVDALRARGHDVVVLTTAPRTPVASPPHVRRALKLADLWDFYAERLSAPVTLRLREAEAFQVSAFNVHALLSALEGFRPDVVYAWMLVGIGGLGLMACLHHLRVPWVWHLMDEVPSKLCALFYRVRPELAREAARQLRGSYLSCSRQLVDEIERSGFPLGDQVSLLPNWVTGPRPSPRGGAFAGGRRLRVVAAAALIDRNYDKGIDLLIRAAGLLREGGYDGFSLDVFGRVNDDSFAALIRERGVSDLVTLKGPLSQDRLLDAYASYDLFAFPGRTAEPFGFAPLEALGRGCVPVINRRCGVGEWLVHGVHCLKAARDAGSFADVFRRVLDGEVSLGPVATRGEAAVWRDFHLDALVPRIETALRAASRRPRAGAGSAAEAYRLAVLAEKLTGILLQEACSA